MTKDLRSIAEIGGDFAQPATPQPEAEDASSRAQGARRRRSRRGRRGSGDRFQNAGPEGAGEETGGEEFEPENVALEPREPAAEVEPASFEQPELPWHMPVAESEPVVAEAPVADLDVVDEAAPDAVAEPVVEAAPEAAEAPEAPPAEAPPAAEPVAAQPEPLALEPVVAEPETPPAPEEPPRPRRTGWWQRARATIVGGRGYGSSRARKTRPRRRAGAFFLARLKSPSGANGRAYNEPMGDRQNRGAILGAGGRQTVTA